VQAQLDEQEVLDIENEKLKIEKKEMVLFKK
jgi:hypothetical protein